MAGQVIDERIVKFFKKHHVLTIATSSGNVPWCASCFYVYMEDENALVFTSSKTTRHGSEFEVNSEVAGTVALETKIIGKIQGIQFSGVISEAEGGILDKAKSSYIRRFPIAALMDTHLWVVRLTHIKMTDNTFGFGKKLMWNS
jgi:uncharacterized protein YhbP (UPF0306 family)